MNIREFNRRILQKQKQLDNLVRRKMPVLAGNIAKRHIENDFRKGGFTHNGFHKWKETARQKNGGKGAASRYGPLLSGRNNLASSIRYTPGDGTVTVFTREPYAATHNQGGTLHPAVTPRMRKFAWARHYEETGKGKEKEGKKEEEEDKEDDTFWKRLALTTKTKLDIPIPQRQFMPETPGPELSGKVMDKLEQEIKKIINT